jgi:hypothetical protein
LTALAIGKKFLTRAVEELFRNFFVPSLPLMTIDNRQCARSFFFEFSSPLPNASQLRFKNGTATKRRFLLGGCRYDDSREESDDVQEEISQQE